MTLPRGEDPYWRTRPGGLAAIDYVFPEEPKAADGAGYSSIEFFFEVVQDPGNELGKYAIPMAIRGVDGFIGYYWANQFGFAGSDKPLDGYFGIQTIGDISQANPSDRFNSKSNRFIKRARIAIFSIWRALDAREVGEGSYCAPFGHEGKGWSCKLEYSWRAGVQYGLRVTEVGDAGEAKWWRASIADASTHRETVIGEIKVPGRWGRLRKQASMFTEYYSTIVNQQVGDADDDKAAPRVCDFMPKAAVKIYPPLANSGSVPLSRMTPKSYGKCAHVSAFLGQDDRAISNETSIAPQIVTNKTGTLERTA